MVEFEMKSRTNNIIKVIGVGGGGSNAVNHMHKLGIVDVDFAICNTDNQALEMSNVPIKIKLGPSLTDGRGAGSKPEIGREACKESLEDIKKYLSQDTRMLFITAGMGGGTGTGAAPIIAEAAQALGILTVGIVTLPFTFEGFKRKTFGNEGLEELRKHVDTLIVISNDKLRLLHGNLTISDAFGRADDVLATAAKGIAEIITVAGMVNVDFEDVNTVMRGSGVAIMGSAMMEGEDRARRAVDAALSSPLLEDNDIQGAQNILLNISSGNQEVTMDEIFEITEFVQSEAGYNTNLIWGNGHDETLGDKISVTIIATGFEQASEKDGDEEDVEVVEVTFGEKKNEPSTSKINTVFENNYGSNPKATVVEFSDIDETIKKVQKDKYSYDAPYIKDEEELSSDEVKPFTSLDSNKSQMFEKDADAIIKEMESKPAFKRQNVELEKKGIHKKGIKSFNGANSFFKQELD